MGVARVAGWGYRGVAASLPLLSSKLANGVAECIITLLP